MFAEQTMTELTLQDDKTLSLRCCSLRIFLSARTLAASLFADDIDYARLIKNSAGEASEQRGGGRLQTITVRASRTKSPQILGCSCCTAAAAAPMQGERDKGKYCVSAYVRAKRILRTAPRLTFFFYYLFSPFAVFDVAE